MNRPSDAIESVRSLSRIVQPISELVVPIVAGLLADWQFGSRPWGLLVGTAIGLLLGVVRVRTILKDLERREQLKAEESRKGRET